MAKIILIIGLLCTLPGIVGCNNKATDQKLQVQTNPQEMKVKEETLK